MSLLPEMLMSNVNIDNFLSEYALKAIQGFRNSKLPPDNHTIFDYVNKKFATNAEAFLIEQLFRSY